MLIFRLEGKFLLYLQKPAQLNLLSFATDHFGMVIVAD